MKCYIDRIYSKDKIEVKDNLVEYYTTNKKKTVIKLECDIEKKEMKASQSKDNVHFVSFSDEEICRNDRIVISDDGSRWEGDVFNQQPFGFGSFYDGEGNRIYSGFMFEGKKIGFGEEYFADNHKVDYCGNFINDKRHGWGITYDRNGEKLYEGDWRCGKNDFEEKIVIEDNCKRDDLGIHDLIKELEIGENCFNEWKGDLIITNYPNLQSIIVKKNSLKNLNSLKICNCEKMKTIKIEDKAFRNVKIMIVKSI